MTSSNKKQKCNAFADAAAQIHSLRPGSAILTDKQIKDLHREMTAGLQADAGVIGTLEEELQYRLNMGDTSATQIANGGSDAGVTTQAQSDVPPIEGGEHTTTGPEDHQATTGQQEVINKSEAEEGADDNHGDASRVDDAVNEQDDGTDESDEGEVAADADTTVRIPYVDDNGDEKEMVMFVSQYYGDDWEARVVSLVAEVSIQRLTK